MDQAYSSDQRCKPGYGGPVVQGPPQPAAVVPIVVNQPMPVVVATPIIMNPDLFKLNPVSIQCPFCLNMITTNVIKNWNCGACCLFCWTGWLIYLCIQLSSGKEFCCCDAVHTCPVCNKPIGTYKAC